MRLALEQLYLPMFLGALPASAVLHVGDMMPLVSRVPSVLLCRNMLLYAPLGKNSLRLRLARQLAHRSLDRAAAVAFVSATMATEVGDQFALKRSVVIHHGPGLTLSSRQPRPPEIHPSLIVIASLYDYKRVELAIDAVDELRRRSWPATLQVVGQPVEKPYFEALVQRVHQLGLTRSVHFTGGANAVGVTESYLNARFALITSRNESFCHPILEAFCAGVPAIIAQDLAVAPEIAGDAALYCPPTGTGFADVVEALLRDEPLYSKHVSLGYRRALEFSWSKTAAETSALLLQCALAQ
jgi:glycosyltransferase involved in cell wall biosynthesis